MKRSREPMDKNRIRGRDIWGQSKNSRLVALSYYLDPSVREFGVFTLTPNAHPKARASVKIKLSFFYSQAHPRQKSITRQFAYAHEDDKLRHVHAQQSREQTQRVTDHGQPGQQEAR